MEKKYLIFSDVDGTIYDRKQEYHKETINSIKSVKNRNAEFIICTGNPYLQNMQELAKLLEVRYFVGSNGAMAIDIQENKILHLNSLTKQEAQIIFDIAIENEVSLDWWDLKYIYANKYKLKGLDKIFKEIVARDMKIITTNKVGNNVLKMEIICENVDEEIVKLDIIEIKLKKLGFQTSRMRPVHIEITSNNVSKGDGALALVNKFEINIENVMTIGDGTNDWPMLKVTNNSYAMGNSSDATKKVAKNITDHVLKNGLGNAMNDFLNKMENKND